MKKLLFLLPLLTIGTVTLTGCPKDKRARLTFGTLVDKEAENIAKNYGLTKEQLIEEFGGIEVVKYDMKMRKAIEILKGE